MVLARCSLAPTVAAVLTLAAAAPALSGTADEAATPKPCSSDNVGGATVVNWCGPAKATVKLGGKTVTFKSGRCGVSPGFDGKPALTVNVGRYTTSPAKPKFSYFGLAGKPKPGTYASGEHLISFQLPGKSYAVQGGPVWGLPWPKVTIAAGGKTGTFSGHAFLGAARKGMPVTGSWSC